MVFNESARRESGAQKGMRVRSAGLLGADRWGGKVRLLLAARIRRRGKRKRPQSWTTPRYLGTRQSGTSHGRDIRTGLGPAPRHDFRQRVNPSPRRLEIVAPEAAAFDERPAGIQSCVCAAPHDSLSPKFSVYRLLIFGSLWLLRQERVETEPMLDAFACLH